MITGGHHGAYFPQNPHRDRGHPERRPADGINLRVKYSGNQCIPSLIQPVASCDPALNGLLADTGGFTITTPPPPLLLPHIRAGKRQVLMVTGRTRRQRARHTGRMAELASIKTD